MMGLEGCVRLTEMEAAALPAGGALTGARGSCWAEAQHPGDKTLSC